jgi:hypothetical protein
MITGKRHSICALLRLQGAGIGLFGVHTAIGDLIRIVDRTLTGN